MQPARKIAVAGATGRLGRHLVDILRAQGHDVVPISRSLGVDVITGKGLAEAVLGGRAVGNGDEDRVETVRAWPLPQRLLRSVISSDR